MLLQFLIPHYKETEQEVGRLLQSIALQQRIKLSDLGVIIVNDGDEVILSEDFIQKWPFQVKYYINKKLGVSAARNKALEEATADYVMFCDADDMFSNVFGLFLIKNEIINKKPDIFFSSFMEEYCENGQYFYKNHDYDTTFIHGKVYRRDYLTTNNITWAEGLTVCEDSYFNGLAFSYTKKTIYCPNVFYTWCWRDGSVTRSNKNFYIESLEYLTEAHVYLINEFMLRKKEKSAQVYVFNLLFTLFLEARPQEKYYGFTLNLYNKTKDFCFKFWELYSHLSKNEKQELIKNFQLFKSTPRDEAVFEQWLQTFLGGNNEQF